MDLPDSMSKETLHDQNREEVASEDMWVAHNSRVTSAESVPSANHRVEDQVATVEEIHVSEIELT